MKYIRIKNNGLIEVEALSLIGASTKTNNAKMIGQFGSGNKYALAYLIRNDYEPKIFSGTKEIVLTTIKKVFRDNEFDVLLINGEPTSITLQMGKDWQFWQAIREVYCNALDEGGCELDFVNHIVPVEGETHFYIDTKKDVMEFIGNFDNYFAMNKKVLFECAKGRILEKTGESANIYRKGIRCANMTKVSVFDYDFNDIDIDENRLVRYNWQIEEMMWDLIFRCDNEEVIMQILHTAHDTQYMEGTASDFITINSSPASDTFKRCLTKNRFANRSFGGLLAADERHNHILLPNKVFESVRGLLGDENVPDKFMVERNGGMFMEIETSPLHDITIKKALEFLKECQFEVPYEIKIAKFEDKKWLGCAYNEIIYISDLCIEQGINDTVNTIIEEYTHIKYKVSDETRGFQDAIISEFITYMKKVNAYAI